MYDLVVNHFQISPSEYWKMTPNEIQVLIEAKRPKTIGGIHEDDLEMLHHRRSYYEQQGYTVV